MGVTLGMIEAMAVIMVVFGQQQTMIKFYPATFIFTTLQESEWTRTKCKEAGLPDVKCISKKTIDDAMNNAWLKRHLIGSKGGQVDFERTKINKKYFPQIKVNVILEGTLAESVEKIVTTLRSASIAANNFEGALVELWSPPMRARRRYTPPAECFFDEEVEKKVEEEEDVVGKIGGVKKFKGETDQNMIIKTLVIEKRGLQLKCNVLKRKLDKLNGTTLTGILETDSQDVKRQKFNEYICIFQEKWMLY
jgi:hypothetical protein